MNTAVVAPALFGRQAELFLEAALSVLPEASAGLASSVEDVARLCDGLVSGDVLLGSLGSNLALLAADAAVERGLVHVEVGAVTDGILGRNSFRLTAGETEMASAAAALVVDYQPSALLVEESAFGLAMRAAAERRFQELGLSAPVRLTMAEALMAANYRSLVTALRPPLPEQLCRDLAGHTGGLERLVAAGGSWTRPEVAPEVAAFGVEAVFCDLPFPEGSGESLYAHLGRAGATVLQQWVVPFGPAREVLEALDLEAGQTLLGHGVRFHGGGRNLRAKAMALRWHGGQLVRHIEGESIANNQRQSD